MGPLIPLFWTSGDVCPGFRIVTNIEEIFDDSKVVFKNFEGKFNYIMSKVKLPVGVFGPEKRKCKAKFMFSNGPSGLDNNVNFLCHQKWGPWLPMLLYTLDDKRQIVNFFLLSLELFLNVIKVFANCESYLNVHFNHNKTTPLTFVSNTNRDSRIPRFVLLNILDYTNYDRTGLARETGRDVFPEWSFHWSFLLGPHAGERQGMGVGRVGHLFLWLGRGWVWWPLPPK